MKNFGPLLAKFLALTFSKGSKNLAYSSLNVIFDHTCEFKQNCYVRRCIYFSWFLLVVLNRGWGVLPRGSFGCHGGLLFFVGAFGEYWVVVLNKPHTIEKFTFLKMFAGQKKIHVKRMLRREFFSCQEFHISRVLGYHFN